MDTAQDKLSLITYSAFVPVDRRRAILTGEPLPDRTYGAALFIDVSGFTSMTERLVNHFGREEGAEAVLRCINPLYDVVIGVLHEHGGSVISFAGDSITCWLDGDDGRRALQCGLGMQAAVNRMDAFRLTDDEVIELGIKAAVAVGTARRFVVGSEERGFLDVLAGQTVLRMAAAEQSASRGELVVDIENLETILDGVVISEWRKDGQVGVVTAVNNRINVEAYRIEPFAWQLSVEQARSWLHAPVFERLQTTGSFLAELRPTTALFLGFDGIDFDDDDAGIHLNQFVQWIQERLQQFSGYLLQLIFGDKGNYLYASFGAPLSFHNNQNRAVTAALAFRSAHERLQKINAVYTGISSGRMWSGAYGGTARATYGIIGNETNMAARLMGKAQPQQIVISSAIFERTFDRFKFEALGEVAIKGRSQPMQLWLVQDYLGQPAKSPRFQRALIGRIDRLSMLITTWEEVKAGEGRIVRIVGVAGIGKSHLVSVFADMYIETEALWGNADSSAQYSSYSAWRPVFMRLLNLSQGADETLLDVIAPRLEVLGLVDDKRLPLLGDLFGINLVENELTAGFEPQARQEALFALLKTILSCAAEQSPLLIILDNTQWLDDTSLQLVMALAPEIEEQAIMLLLITRPVEGEAWEFLAEHSEMLALLPLNVNELHQLVREQLGGEVAPLVLDVVERQTLGHPFFIDGLLVAMRGTEKVVPKAHRWELADSVRKTLIAGNTVEFRDGEWRLSETETAASLDIELPNTIHASILHQIDTLSEQCKLTLKVAGAIGHQFDLDLLHRVHPQKPKKESIRKCADSCIKHGLIHWYDDETYTFNHHLTQEVTYSTLLYAQRRELRASVAQVLVKPDYKHMYSTEMIADHAYEGGEWALALDAYRELGDEAKSLFANQQAIFAYQRAAECIRRVNDSGSKRPSYEIEMALGELFTRTSDFEEARTHLNRALTLAETSPEYAAVYRWLAESWEKDGKFGKALEQIYLGLRYESEETTYILAEMRIHAGLIYTRQGSYDKADALVEQVFGTGYKPALHGRAYSLSGTIQRLRGNRDYALTQFKKALIEYDTVSNVRGRALALNQMATIHFDHGEYETAEKLYQEARHIFVQTGNRYHHLFVSNNLGGIARLIQNYEQALVYFDDALHQLDLLSKSPYVWGMIEMNRAIVFSELGRFDEAEKGFGEARRLFDYGSTQDTLPELYREKARLALKQAKFDAAEQWIEQSLMIARGLNMSHDLALATMIQERIVAARTEKAGVK